MSVYRWEVDHPNFDVLLGQTLTDVVNHNNEEIIFTSSNEDSYKLLHFQDCCESVYVEDIVGDLGNLVGSPILMAEEVSNEPEVGEWGDSTTWTFYKLATIKGYVTIRWCGSSNGYYSESVDFIKIPGEGE